MLILDNAAPRAASRATNHLFEQLAAGFEHPSRLFAELPDGAHISYGDLDAASARFAQALIAQGVEPGDRVAVQAEKRIEFIYLWLGCVAAGAVFVPLNPAYTATEIAYFLADAEPRLFLCEPARREELAAVAPEAVGVLAFDDFIRAAHAAPAQRPDIARGPDDLAAILYTSGTTGRSKGAMLTHANLASNARTLVDYWRFTSDDVLLHALPLFHIHGLFVATNTVLAAGASMIFQPKFDADAILTALPRASVLMGVPTFYTRLLQHPGLTPEATRSVRLFVSGSAPLLADTHHEWQARTGHMILERYGMTETSMITSNPYDGARIAGTVGLPLPGVEVRITDLSDGVEMPPTAVGMIEVRGPNVFRGYWRMPEKTAEEFRPDGFFITGDLGTIGADGYVRIVGRGKDLVISGGYNVYPKEVEERIDAVPGVLESAVIGVPHPDFGEGVTAVVVLQPGAALDEAAILQAIAPHLARFKQPKRVFFVPELPRNTMGKVQKNLLKERYAATYRN